jgi:predicted enzyme related to lactoylglutathione lyase
VTIGGASRGRSAGVDAPRAVAHGVKIVRGPVVETYGTVAVFEDLYGNRWDLVQRR